MACLPVCKLSESMTSNPPDLGSSDHQGAELSFISCHIMTSSAKAVNMYISLSAGTDLKVSYVIS